MEEELLTTLSRLSNVIGGFVTAVLIPVAGYWGYREYNKRKAAAEAKKAEADNITQYAAEWKELVNHPASFSKIDRLMCN